MKTKMILKLLFIFSLALSSCNKDDDNKDEQGGVKDENLFEAEFDGETIEPHYAQGGGFGLYTLNFQRCPSNDNNWNLSVNTDANRSLFIYLIGVNSTGNYILTSGDPNHVAIQCFESNSIYILDETTYTYSFISSSNGTIEITEYDSGYGILVGTFSAEMVSTADPTVKKTITGAFNLNKSTLDNTQRPCWL